MLILLSFVGFLDSLFLTYEHYFGGINSTICKKGVFIDCGKVLDSKYAVLFGIFPLALLGAIHYFLLFILSIAFYKTKKIFIGSFILAQSFIGFLFSIYLVYLQIFPIGSFCLFCILSALISTLFFFWAFLNLKKERVFGIALVLEFLYKNFLKRILFLFDAELVHESFLNIGEFLGKNKFFKFVFNFKLGFKDKKIKKEFLKLEFNSPIGLAAGFDYKAKLPFILPKIGFGFATIGTITNLPYEGNEKPRLGRLPKSKSLLVNKGYKNEGAEKIAQKIKNKKFEFPIGISIGRSNSEKLNTVEKSIKDIISAFKIFEQKNLYHSYYELNISCPNINGGDHLGKMFYDENNLKNFLKNLEKLNIKRPIFVKMPIDVTDKKAISILKILDKHQIIKGIIFGNLQKDRKNKYFDKNEIKKAGKGNFSGKPTFVRSNQLIALSKKQFENRFLIIGCGGVFSAKDAQAKFDAGADLVQLITGMIFEGPQVIAKINCELVQ